MSTSEVTKRSESQRRRALRRLYLSAPVGLRPVFRLLRQFAPAHLTQSDIETTLNWSPGEVSRLCADRQTDEDVFERLFHTSLAETASSGEQELWLDERQTSALDGLFEGSGASSR